MQPTIESIEYFVCGTCRNNLRHLFKHSASQPMTFPAGVFLIKHQKMGYILYDTGYSTSLLKNNFKYWLYRSVTPIQISENQMIGQQLQKKGIQPKEIRWVILSHLHPDHIGGVKQFSEATFLMTEKVFQNYQQSSLKDLIFKELLPVDFLQRIQVLSTDSQDSAFPYQNVSDIFGDRSLLLLSLDGHAKGQGCLYIREKNLLIAADVCWGIDLLAKSSEMKRVPRMIQNDWFAYCKSNELIQQLLKDGLQVVVSHDPAERVFEVLA